MSLTSFTTMLRSVIAEEGRMLGRAILPMRSWALRHYSGSRGLLRSGGATARGHAHFESPGRSGDAQGRLLTIFSSLNYRLTILAACAAAASAFTAPAAMLRTSTREISPPLPPSKSSHLLHRGTVTRESQNGGSSVSLLRRRGPALWLHIQRPFSAGAPAIGRDGGAGGTSLAGGA